MAEAAHDGQHGTVPGPHHGHGGDDGDPEPRRGPGCRDRLAVDRHSSERRPLARPVRAGRGHPARDALCARPRRRRHRPRASPRIAFGALLPDWLDPIMGRIVGFTLVALGLWVLYSVYRYASAGERVPPPEPLDARVRRRSATAGGSLQARLHGHEHVEPLEMSSYGAGTSFGVGMIHGIGAETGTQVLLIAAVGGASSAGLGVPMLFAFVLGLLMSNFAIVLISSVGFVVEPVARADLRGHRRRGGPVQPVRRVDLPVRPRRRPAGPRRRAPLLIPAVSRRRPVRSPFMPSWSWPASLQT